MIGFYVHHHGAGHLSRTLAVLGHLSAPAAVFSSLPIDPARVPAGTWVVRLPDDTVDVDRGIDADCRGALHWAPIGFQCLQQRTALLVDWLRRPQAQLLVCDVSVEVALLARLCSVEPVVVRDHGIRTDRAHQLGFDVAPTMIAPFPEELEDPAVPADVRRRTWYAGLYGQASGRRLSRAEARASVGVDSRIDSGRLLVIVVGAGGTSFDVGAARAIGDVLPGWDVAVLGPFPPGRVNDHVRIVGWAPDPFAWMRAADVVAGHGGANLLAEVAAADRPFVCVPEARPHDEQRVRAHLLADRGAAVVGQEWLPAQQWPDLVAAARRVGSTQLHGWSHSASPAVVARFLESKAAGTDSL